ncbi:hypothetical protein DL766_004996 [Monosporascus sp. MC13-8B]|uniref:lytic cellulose monooxygenase (C4-dehydrogenating) n=1 Tax=Monosporascus cannonballus TaxID=155416 RepID=A0ABY0H8R1_9PEZI|nr:hypothetical protein DL762_004127 [Monosporascus cannonballus]RYO94350.1 hypothetical protein DL763_004066 [Monosporascus cannonballus]RYP30168.1 hypothetical protein DL766_004996 [Monosporascus sp. MC13-8B]
MRLTALSAAAVLAGTASAHTQMFSVWVNGKDQGDGRNVYIRSPPNNSPVVKLGDPAMACNVNGGKVAPKFVSAAAGDKLSFEWYHNNRNDDIIDLSHKGPVITYIAPYTEGDGSGAIWTKIDEDGYDGSKWAVEKLVANKGKKDFTLPSSLAPGQYLVRQEMIGLHEADALFTAGRGAQFYPSCVQLEVTGSGTEVPSQNYDIVKGYNADEPGILFNLYGSYNSYPIPGPDVFSSGSGSKPAPAPSPKPTTAAPSTLVTVTKTPAASKPPATPVDPKPNADSPTADPKPPADPKQTADPKPPADPKPTTAAGTGVGAASLYGQCGGINWTGPTACAKGTCKQWNDWYHQCVN